MVRARILPTIVLAWLAAPAVADAPEAGAAPAPGVARELVRETFTLDHLSSDWEVLLHDPDGVFPSAGQLHVRPSPSADGEAISRVRNVVRHRRPLAGSRLEVRVRVELAIEEAGHGAALVLYQDDRNWVELAFRGERDGGGLRRVVRLRRSVGGKLETVVAPHGSGPSPAPEALTLVLERDGDVFAGRTEVAMGPPGVVRRGSVGHVEASGLGDLQLMLKAERAEAPLGAEIASVEFDDVVAVGRSSDAALGDVGETLQVAYATDFRDPVAFHREFSVLRPQPGSLVLENGLELVARYGIPGDDWTPIRNLVVLNRPLPDGIWDVEVEVDARFTSRHDDVGIVLYGEQGNALYVGHWALPGRDDGGRQAYLRSVIDGRGETRFSKDPAARTDVEATTLVFRIERTAEAYLAWLDVAGRGWVRLGEVEAAKLPLVEPRIGLFARSARDRGQVPGAGVRFARLWIMVEQPGPASR